MEDCDGELPFDITLSNIQVNQELIDTLGTFLQSIKDIKIYSKIFDVTLCHLENKELKLAIQLDMRFLIAYVLCKDPIGKLKQISVYDHLLACLENCNGCAFRLMKDLWHNGYKKEAKRLCIRYFDDFLRYEKSEQITLVEICRRDSISYYFNTYNFVVRNIPQDMIQRYEIKGLTPRDLSTVCDDEYISSFESNIYAYLPDGLYRIFTYTYSQTFYNPEKIKRPLLSTYNMIIMCESNFYSLDYKY